MTAPANVTFRIRRFDPATQQPPAWEDITLPYTHGMTVLDGLRVIKETVPPTLAWRSSCRMGVCGSCGMFINGHPRLACNTQITELGTSLVTVAPLPNFDIIRDLVPDLRPMFDAHTALHAAHHPRRRAGDARADRGVLPVAARTGAVPPVHVLHQVRLLHGRVPHRGHRPGVLGADAARPVAPLQRGQPRRRASTPARRCWPPRRGRGSATTRASARRPARRAWTRRARSS